MLLSDLLGKKLIDEDGVTLGRVMEVRSKNSQVEFLIAGTAGLLQRIANFRTGERVAWKDVKRIEAGKIICSRQSPKAKKAKG